MALHRIATALRKSPRCSDKDLGYLHLDLAVYFSGPFTSTNIVEIGSEEDLDDAYSISSVSTNATMDDIPGTGRIIDKCIYQFFGRKIERFANRISIAFLSPDKIVHFLWVDRLGSSWPPMAFPLHEVISSLSYEFSYDLMREPDACVAGLKSLVAQTKSGSLYRSAAALAALIRLSSSSYSYGRFYTSVAGVEPIFHLESLATLLSKRHPEKKYFLCLATLARAQLDFTWREPSERTEEVARSLRRGLMRIMQSCRSPDHDLLTNISNACTLFARSSSYAYSFLHADKTDTPADHSIVETTYFLTVFLIHSLTTQYHTRSDSMPSTQQLHDMVLLTHATWIQNIALSNTLFVGAFRDWRHRAVQYIYILRSPILAYNDAQAGFLFSKARARIGDNQVIERCFLPRRIRATTTWQRDPLILRINIMRSSRLLNSLEELEREVRDHNMGSVYGSAQPGLTESPLEKVSDEELRQSRHRAQQVHVNEDDSSREFSDARKGDWYSSLGRWEWYKRKCQMRRRWGEYFRSNMDWDWDLSNSLKRLYEVENSKKPPQRIEALQATVTVASDGCNGHVLEVSINEPQLTPPIAVRVRYLTKAGEVKYSTFHCSSSSAASELQ